MVVVRKITKVYGSVIGFSKLAFLYVFVGVDTSGRIIREFVRCHGQSQNSPCQSSPSLLSSRELHSLRT